MSKVTLMKTSPESVVKDYHSLMELANYQKVLAKTAKNIVKINLSWSLFYPACSSPPWQLDGVLNSFKKNNIKSVVVENQTVVTHPWKGAYYNKWLPIMEKYGVEYKPLTDVKWVKYKPKKEMLAMNDLFPEILVPKMFLGSNVIQLPTVKCVHPETEIFLSDGSLIPIGEVVREVHNTNEINITEDGDCVAVSNHDLPTLSHKGEFDNGKALKFWQTPSPKEVFKIKTKTGKEVTVSEEHPFLTPDGWKKAKDLTNKMRIAIPRKVKVKGKSQKLPEIRKLNHDAIKIDEICFKEGKRLSIKEQKKIIKEYIKGATTTDLAKKFKTHYETIRSILKRYNIDIRWRRKWIKSPEKTSEDFWRWFGYFTAEGYAKNCKGSMRFWWGNGNKRVVEDYKKLTKKLFGINLKIRKRKDKIDVYYFDSNHIISFFENLGVSFPLVAGTKMVPSLLFKCPKKEIAAFLQGYLDGDGTVSKDGVYAVSKSKELIKKIQLLLIRLGVISFIRSCRNIATNGLMKRKEIYWQISVHADDLVIFSKYFKFKSAHKQKKIENLVEKRKKSLKKPSNWDTVPVDAALFRKVRKGLGFTQNSSGKPSAVNSIENRYSLPTKHIMNYFIKLFERTDKENKFQKELEYFKFLISDDIAWDHIIEIKRKKSDTNFLYDLSVPTTNNFIGNGVVLHNTHGHTTTTGAIKNAFGGLIPKYRHHAHKKIHEVLVDLLQIQKEIHKGIFAVMDGCVCGEGAGPRTMNPFIGDLILASEDQVAIDAVAAKIMGFDPMKIKYIKLAHDRGLGVGDVDQIDFDNKFKKLNFGFTMNKSPVIKWDQRLRKGIKNKAIHNFLFHSPIFKMFIFASEFYHDKFWYPGEGKKNIKNFKKTKWGKVFDDYKYGKFPEFKEVKEWDPY